MAIVPEEVLRQQTVRTIAQRMLVAAKTAPKGKGADQTVMALVEGEDIKRISDTMKDMAKRFDLPGFLRDAENILLAEILVLIGTKISPLGLKKCGLCGFENCAKKDEHKNIPCAFNTGDLGIAIGSAVSIASDNRLDNRIMYSVGLAVAEMRILGDGVKIIYGIPLSAGPKNPFFDRK